jgi:hypothetical protein
MHTKKYKKQGNLYNSIQFNVTERNGSNCKYVEIFTHRFDSIGAPSRRTVFIRGTNTKQLEVPKIIIMVTIIIIN